MRKQTAQAGPPHDQAARRPRATHLVCLLASGLCLLGLAACLVSLSGCLAGAVLAKMPQYTPAKYVPDKNKPMLVWAENYTDPTGAGGIDADQLARLASEHLEQHKVAPIIDPARAMDLRSRDRARFRQMPITLIGQEAGAAQVVYVSIANAATETPGASDMMRGSATAMVRVVDVQTGATLWPPAASEGYPVSVATPMTRLSDGADEAAVRESVQVQLATEVARLFYKYDPMAE